MPAQLTALGEAITAARTGAGLSQPAVVAELNARTGGNVSAQNLSAWERGTRILPSPEVIAVLADILGGDPVRWCAFAGKIHPGIARALMDPGFASAAYELADERKCIDRPAGAWYGADGEGDTK